MKIAIAGEDHCHNVLARRLAQRAVSLEASANLTFWDQAPGGWSGWKGSFYDTHKAARDLTGYLKPTGRPLYRRKRQDFEPRPSDNKTVRDLSVLFFDLLPPADRPDLLLVLIDVDGELDRLTELDPPQILAGFPDPAAEAWLLALGRFPADRRQDAKRELSYDPAHEPARTGKKAKKVLHFLLGLAPSVHSAEDVAPHPETIHALLDDATWHDPSRATARAACGLTAFQDKLQALAPAP